MSRAGNLRLRFEALVIRWLDHLPPSWTRRAFQALCHGQRARYSAELLLEKRLWIFLFIDLNLILGGLIEALVSGGGSESVYRGTVFWPSLLLGLPASASVVALERRAGSLDLALSVPSTERYFRLRLFSIHGVLLIQGLILTSLAHSETSSETTGEWLRVMYQCLELQCVLAAIVLFWATRLDSSGAVLLSSAATVGLLFPWLTRSPDVRSGQWTAFGLHQPLITWWVESVFIAVAAVLFILYARVRLRRPETLLS